MIIQVGKRLPSMPALASACCLRLLRSASTRSKIASATSSFGAIGTWCSARALDDRDLVAGRVEADLRPRDVVEDDRIDRLASSFSRARSTEAPASAAKPTSVWSGRRVAASAGEDVLGRLEPQLEAPPSSRESLPSAAPRLGSRRVRRPSAARGRSANSAATASASSAVVSTATVSRPAAPPARRWRRSASPPPHAAPPPRPVPAPSGRSSGCR